MKKDLEQNAKKVDKLITGIVIGGAIGSVIGLALSPKSGKENRKFMKEKAGEALEKSKDFIEQHKPQAKKKGWLHIASTLLGLDKKK